MMSVIKEKGNAIKMNNDQYSAARVTMARPIPMKMTMKTPPMLWMEIPPLLSSASSQAFNAIQRSGKAEISRFYDGFNSALESNLIKEKTDLLLWILIPPSLFQCLQLPLVQQLQDPENCKRVLSVIKYIFPS